MSILELISFLNLANIFFIKFLDYLESESDIFDSISIIKPIDK